MEPFEFWANHPLQTDPNFSKTYAKYKRFNHHYHYLACLFKIEDNCFKLVSQGRNPINLTPLS